MADSTQKAHRAPDQAEAWRIYQPVPRFHPPPLRFVLSSHANCFLFDFSVPTMSTPTSGRFERIKDTAHYLYIVRKVSLASVHVFLAMVYGVEIT